jgi:hypothetical protein
VARSLVTEDRAKKEASCIMLHVGLDLSRKRVDVCLISDRGELVGKLAAPFDEDGLCRLADRVAAKHAHPSTNPAQCSSPRDAATSPAALTSRDICPP